MGAPATNKTLGQLATSMAVRLGYGAQGAAITTLLPVFREYLNDAQNQLVELFSSLLLQDYTIDRQMYKGQVLYDIHPDADPQRIDQVSVLMSGEWLPINNTIKMYHLGNDLSGYPYRYQVKYGTTGQAQIEFSPEPDQDYTYGYFYHRKVKEMVDTGDRTTINSNLVKLFALANAAADRGHKSSDRLTKQADTMLGQLRARANDEVQVTRGTPRRPTHLDIVEFTERINQIEFTRDFLISESGGVLIPE